VVSVPHNLGRFLPPCDTLQYRSQIYSLPNMGALSCLLGELILVFLDPYARGNSTSTVTYSVRRSKVFGTQRLLCVCQAPADSTLVQHHSNELLPQSARKVISTNRYGLGTPQKLNTAHWVNYFRSPTLFSNHIYEFNILRTGIITNNQAGQTVFMQHNLVLTLEVVERGTNCQRPSMMKDTRNGPLLHRLSLSIAHSRCYARVN